MKYSNYEVVLEEKRKIEEAHGPWSAHDIPLKFGLWTLDSATGEHESVKNKLHSELRNEQSRFAYHLQAKEKWSGHSPTSSHINRFVQIIEDMRDKPWEALSILDLGCLEGGHSFEFASLGAHVVGVEGRTSNIEKCEFAKRIREDSTVQFCLDDVRNVTLEKYGEFDFVLCSGLIYHLEGETVSELARNLVKISRRGVLFDTHLNLIPKDSISIQGINYHGAIVQEHDKNSSTEDKIANIWQSIDNETSFRFTRFSLFNLLKQAGFTSVYDCVVPSVFWGNGDRVTLVALKGNTVPQLNTAREPTISESYSEINSGKYHSEFHALLNRYDLLSRNPLVLITQLSRRVLRTLRKFGSGK